MIYDFLFVALLSLTILLPSFFDFSLLEMVFVGRERAHKELGNEIHQKITELIKVAAAIKQIEEERDSKNRSKFINTGIDFKNMIDFFKFRALATKVEDEIKERMAKYHAACYFEK